MKWKKCVIMIVITIIIIVLAIISLPYIRTEYLTLKYGDEFVGLEQQTHMLDQTKYHKVFSYNEYKADVFYVSDTGDLISFVKNSNGQWQIKEWKTIWSKSGSAEGFIWPYYR